MMQDAVQEYRGLVDLEGEPEGAYPVIGKFAHHHGGDM